MFFFTGGTPEMTYITGGKYLLTFLILVELVKWEEEDVDLHANYTTVNVVNLMDEKD